MVTGPLDRVYGPPMDTSGFKTTTWLMLGGALAMLVGGFFLDWSTVELGALGSVSGGNAFDWFRGWVSLVLVVGVGVVAFLRVRGQVKDGGIPWNLASVLAAAVAVVLLGTLMLLGPDESGFDLGRGPGLYVAFIASIVSLAGAFQEFVAGGGNIKDLADVDKIRDSFKKKG
jgi:hypothetical protein